MKKVSAKTRDHEAEAVGPPSLPLDRSVGYQVRMTHKLIQRALQIRIEKHGVSLGMWYFLRALWDQDGLTQSELSTLIGTMEPTTLSAVALMEQSGLVRRERNRDDKRKINVFLTKKGRALQAELLPEGIAVVNVAVKTFSEREVDLMLTLLKTMQANLAEDIDAHVSRGRLGRLPKHL